MSVGLYLYQMTLLVKSLVDIHQIIIIIIIIIKGIYIAQVRKGHKCAMYTYGT